MAALKSMFHEGAPYAFVSYSHRDEIMLKTLEQIQQVYNIWWDGEMLAGDRWDSERAMPAIEGCNCVLAFYSHSYINSIPCRNEIETALKFDKKIIPVSVEGVSLQQLILDVESKLDAESEDLKRIHKLCMDIGGGEKSTSGNKKLYVNLKSTEWSDTLYRSLEPYLKPSVYMRDWLVNTKEYKLMTEYLTMLENGLDPEIEMDESNETSTEYIFRFLAGMSYALEHKGEVMPKELSQELGEELMCYYGFDEDSDITVSDLSWVLYRMIFETRCMEPFMKKGGDYVDLYSAEAALHTLKWMHDRGMLNGVFNFFYYNNPDTPVWKSCSVVETVENLLKYMEKTYPEALKVFVLGKQSSCC